DGLHLCEVSLVEVEPGILVAFHRENSRQGWDCFKTISRDNGENWGQVIPFPLPGCHRPVAGVLRDGQLLITYRFLPGGRAWAHNFFAALTDKESALAPDRNSVRVRIFPLDYDRSPACDTGYSGWVQFPDGEIYAVNYLVDEAAKAWIRGYSFFPEDIILPQTQSSSEAGSAHNPV
ncbi:MAG TPA: sialidase family protein, partial [bacterium]|nr:sialidase family protein [bacterium]